MEGFLFNVAKVNFVLILSNFVLISGHEKLLFHFRRKSTFDNTMVNDGTIWTKESNNLVDCSLKCLKDSLCNAYFYSDNSCHGYYHLEPINSNSLPANGVVFYTKRFKAEDECVGDGAVNDPANFRCFKSGSQQQSWSDAEISCRAENGTLATLNTTTSIDLLTKLPASKCSPDIFVPGINKCFWLTTSLASWADSGTDCATRGGSLAYTFPDNQTYFTVLTEFGITTSSEQWWIGYNDILNEIDFIDPYGNAMVWSNFESVGWFNKDCVILDPSVNFKWREEDCALSYKALCEQELSIKYWVGASDVDVEGTWKWNNGDVMDMTNWHSSQPDGTSVENCAALWYQGTGNKFSDESCAENLDFICEIPFK